MSRKNEFGKTIVRRGATVGANAITVCGGATERGEFCLIAARAVVTKDVPACALAAGVPAKLIGWMSKTGETQGPNLICPKDGTMF